MNLLKRGLISIKRQVWKSIILFVIILLLSTVMIISLLVDQSTTGAKNTVLKTLPPVVEIVYNDELGGEVFQSEESYTKLREEHIPLTPDKVEEIYKATEDLVDFYDYTTHLMVEVDPSLKLTSIMHPEMYEPATRTSEEDRVPYMTLTGTRLVEFMQYREGKITLTEGRLFTEEEVNTEAHVTLVPAEFAAKNNLKVGDKIASSYKILLYDPGNMQTLAEFKFDLEIVGIIDMKRPNEDEIKQISIGAYEYEMFVNQLIVSNKLVDGLNIDGINAYISSEKIEDVSFLYYEVDGAQFSLKNATESSQFVERAKTVYDTPLKKYATFEKQVNQVAEPLNQSQNTVRMVFVGTVAASILVLSLLQVIFARERKKEIGIYLALGEKKSKISGQLIIEMLIIATVASTIALVIGYFLGGTLTHSMIQQTLLHADPNNISVSSIQIIDLELIANNFKVGIDVMSVLLFYFTMIATVIISQAVTALFILRLDPKKIMM